MSFTKRYFVKVIISKAVCLQECSLREFRLYNIRSIKLKYLLILLILHCTMSVAWSYTLTVNCALLVEVTGLEKNLGLWDWIEIWLS